MEIKLIPPPTPVQQDQALTQCSSTIAMAQCLKMGGDYEGYNALDLATKTTDLLFDAISEAIGKPAKSMRNPPPMTWKQLKTVMQLCLKAAAKILEGK